MSNDAVFCCICGGNARGAKNNNQYTQQNHIYFPYYKPVGTSINSCWSFNSSAKRSPKARIPNVSVA